MNSSETCPISGGKGIFRRMYTGAELAANYASYFGQSVPDRFITKYFSDVVHEYQCDQSGLRWYSPARMAEGDFYEWLGEAFPWYYSSTPTWDKLEALNLISEIGTCRFVEVGCGNGVFLKLARERGVEGVGTEINAQAIQSCRQARLQVYHADERPEILLNVDTIVSLQSLEHVLDPLRYLQQLVAQFPAKHIVIAVPCFESLLGRTTDPLVWPPHHYTAWSKKSFETLGDRLGYSLAIVRYQPLGYDDYRAALLRENCVRTSRLVPFPDLGRLTRMLFRFAQRVGPRWLKYGHSITVVLTKTAP